MPIVRYHPGGFIPARPAQNMAESIDATGFTTWDTAGAITLQRALNADETAQLTAQDAATNAATNTAALLTKMRNALNANATFLAKPSPLLLTDLEAQVRLLTRECNGIMRTVGGWLDTITGA